MINDSRSYEAIQRFDMFKRIVTLALFVFVLFAFVRGLNGTVEGEPDALSAAEVESGALEAAVITTPDQTFVEGDLIELRGTGPKNSIVAIFLDGIEQDFTAVDRNGRWVYRFPDSLPADTYSASAVTVDGSGNTAQNFQSSTLLVVLSATEQLEEAIVPTLEPPAVTNAISQTIRLGEPVLLSGKGVPGSIVTILDGDEEIIGGKAIVDADGTWSLDLRLDEPGEYDLTFVAADTDGNRGALGNRIALTVQAPPPSQPTIALSELPAGFEGGEVSVSGVADAETVIGIVYDGKIFDVTSADIDGNWEFSAEFNTPGEHTLAAQVINPNSDIVVISEPVAFNIVGEAAVDSSLGVDNTEFVTPTVTLPALGSEFFGGIIPLAGSASPGSTVVILINNRTVGVVTAEIDATWGYSTTLSVPETYNIYVRVVDGSGRTVASSDVQTLTVLETTEEEELANESNPEDPCGDDFTPGEFLPNNKYRVAECETLTYIARRAAVSIDELVAVNPQIEDPSRITPEEIINLP